MGQVEKENLIILFGLVFGTLIVAGGLSLCFAYPIIAWIGLFLVIMFILPMIPYQLLILMWWDIIYWSLKIIITVCLAIVSYNYLFK